MEGRLGLIEEDGRDLAGPGPILEFDLALHAVVAGRDYLAPAVANVHLLPLLQAHLLRHIGRRHRRDGTVLQCDLAFDGAAALDGALGAGDVYKLSMCEPRALRLGDDWHVRRREGGVPDGPVPVPVGEVGGAIDRAAAVGNDGRPLAADCDLLPLGEIGSVLHSVDVRAGHGVLALLVIHDHQKLTLLEGRLKDVQHTVARGAD
mmetsp:Transcript_123012/g.353400  ORF Transcript_123012/g.353400 Transcript_123012/m.353400 type:complete len:205 (+) Transcript_123012:2044-2658(+)